MSATQAAPRRTPAAELQDIHSLASLASELSHRLNQVVSSSQGSADGDVLARWLAGCANDSDQNRLSVLCGGARLVLISPVSAAMEVLAVAGSHDGAVHAVLPGGALAVLIPGTPGAVGDDRALRLAQGLGEKVVRQDKRATVATSGPLDSVLDLHRTLQDVRDAGAASPGHRVLFAQELWAEIGVLRLTRAAATLVPEDNPIARLLKHDERHGTDLARTLLLWLDEGGKGLAVARKLYLHVNSVRYRVQRALDIAGLSLEDNKQRLLTHILLQAAHDTTRQTAAHRRAADSLLPTTKRRPPQ